MGFRASTLGTDGVPSPDSLEPADLSPVGPQFSNGNGMEVKGS